MPLVYPSFPQRGVELSKYTRIKRIDFSKRRDAIHDRMDDGMWETSRARGSGELVERINDRYFCPEDDYTVINTFMSSVDIGVQPFWYFHPYAGGQILVKNASDTWGPIEVAIDGGLVWLQFNLLLRGVAG